MSSGDYQRAIGLLEPLGDIEAAKILSVKIDLDNFLQSNRLDLDETEIRELKAHFRA